MPDWNSAAVIGLGEAGTIFAGALRGGGLAAVKAYDILIHDPAGAKALRRRAETAGAELCDSNAAAIAGADLIVCTVTADQALVAARTASESIRPEQVYLDLNSASPKDKRAAAEAIGTGYIDGVAMDTVQQFAHRVPLLLCGPMAETVLPRLRALDLSVEAVSPEVGTASTIKLLRSVVVKGIEALLAESLLAAGKLGVADRVLRSLEHTYAGLDWDALASYHLGRLAKHGKRRAAELRASAETLEALGVEPIMARAIVERQQWSVTQDLRTKLDERERVSVQEFVDAVIGES